MFVIIIVATILVAIAVDTWYRKFKHRSMNSMPSSRIRELPIIGHAHIFLGSDKDRMNAFKTLANETNENGGLQRIWFARRMFLLVTDPDTAELVLKTFIEKDDIMESLRFLTGTGSIFSEVSIWKPRRKKIQAAFSPKVLKQFVEVFQRNSDILVEKLSQVCTESPVSAWNYLVSYAMDAVCETNLGINIHAQHNPDQPFIRAFEQLSEDLAERVCQPWLQVNWIFRLLPRYRTLMKTKAVMFDFIMKVIRSRREEMTQERNNNAEVDRDQGTKTSIKSFLDMLINISEETGGLSNSDLRDECVVIAVAGTDTSAVGVCFSLCMLARHPDVQQKAYEEIQQVLGNEKRPVTNEDLLSLRYIDAVVRETLRLYPPVPVIVRKVNKKLELPSGQTLVPGMGVLIQIWGTHRNPKYWGPDPNDFRPERFLEGISHPVAFIPFSQGPRNCLGYQYAMMSMKTVLANILRNYKVSPPPADENNENKNLHLDVKFDIMMKDVDNFMIRLEPRK